MSVHCPKAANVTARGGVIPCLGASAARDPQPGVHGSHEDRVLGFQLFEKTRKQHGLQKEAWHVWLHVAAGVGGEAQEGDGRLQLRALHVVGALLHGHCVHIDFLLVEKVIRG